MLNYPALHYTNVANKIVAFYGWLVQQVKFQGSFCNIFMSIKINNRKYKYKTNYLRYCLLIYCFWELYSRQYCNAKLQYPNIVRSAGLFARWPIKFVGFMLWRIIDGFTSANCFWATVTTIVDGIAIYASSLQIKAT